MAEVCAALPPCTACVPAVLIMGGGEGLVASAAAPSCAQLCKALVGVRKKGLAAIASRVQLLCCIKETSVHLLLEQLV